MKKPCVVNSFKKLPIVLKSFLTCIVDRIPAERNLSAIAGEIFMIAQRPRKGKAE